MTNKSKTEIKRQAQKAMKENGYKVFQKDIVLLETGYTESEMYGCKMVDVSYVMFEDRKTGKQWQCYHGVKYYNPEKGTLWTVVEYIA